MSSFGNKVFLDAHTLIGEADTIQAYDSSGQAEFLSKASMVPAPADGNTIINNSSNQLEVNIDDRTIKMLPTGNMFEVPGPNKLGVTQWNIMDRAATANLTLTLDTRTSVMCDTPGDLTVLVNALTSTIDKLSTVVIRPIIPGTINISWVGDVTPVWTTTEEVTTLASGKIAVVNVWQIGGIVLLSKVYSS